MGTKQEVLNLQLQLKGLIKEIGWTQNKLARIIFTELSETDNEVDRVAFQERFKKALQRDTTKVELLETYLEIAVSHPDAKDAKRIFKKYAFPSALSPVLSDGMRKISKEIDAYLKK
jgi:hypothetical protein